jgi:hypothetical protein
MLPDFRFLFAAIVLSMSILVFGLGAAALLRAAHEQFASTPSWHASPEPVFAQQTDTTAPVLAMLHVEPPAADEKALDQIATPVAPAEQPVTSAVSAEHDVTAKPAEPEVTAKPAEPELTPVPTEPDAAVTTAEREATAIPAEPEKTAVPAPKESSQPETAESKIPGTENPTPQEPAPAQAAIAPIPSDETKVATSAPALEQGPAPASEAALAAPEQAAPPIAAAAGIASTRIATLGGPPVTIEASPSPAKTTAGKHDKSAIKKHVEARRKARHRRTASRARIVQELAQQPTDPFGQPYVTTRRR